VVVVFLIAVQFNIPWEITVAPLYVGTGSWSNLLLHCALAILRDGVLVVILYAVGYGFFRRADWYRFPTAATVGVMLVTGLAIAVGVERVAVVRLGRWAYTDSMPLIPGLALGLVPILQVLVPPPLIFRFASRWTE